MDLETFFSNPPSEALALDVEITHLDGHWGVCRKRLFRGKPLQALGCQRKLFTHDQPYIPTDLHIFRPILDDAAPRRHLHCTTCGGKEGEVHPLDGCDISLRIELGGVGQDFPASLLALSIPQ